MTESLPDDSTTTVVIPTYNAGQRFADLLDSLETQTLKSVQIIVVDSESTDKTLEIAKRQNCKVITIKRSDFDHGATRNLAASNVQTEFIVFLTQDAIPADEHTIEELIKPMQNDPDIAICYGRQLPHTNANPLEIFARRFNYPPHSALKTKNDIETLGLKTFFCSNSCSAVRRCLFDKLGGFKNNVLVNEDMLFAAGAILQGYSVYYSASAKVYHSHPYSLRRIFKRYFNIGRFFAGNKWILENAKLKGYGTDMLKAGIRTFRNQRRPQYIIALFIEFIVKALACRLGWYYQVLFHKQRVSAESQP